MENTTALENEVPQKQSVLKKMIWILFTLFCLLFFIIVKIPKTKINNYLLAEINRNLEPSGYQLSADKGDLGIGFGIHYTMNGVRVLKLANNRPLSFQKLTLTPSLFAIISGKVGADFLLEEGDGKVTGKVMLIQQEVEADLTIDSLNLGRIGLIPFLTDFEGSAEAKGDIHFQKNAGSVKLELSKIIFDEAKVQGFPLPKIQVSSANIDVDFDSKKCAIKTLKLGKKAPSDDLNATVTGSIKLAPFLENSELSLKVLFSMSERILPSFSLVEAFLGPMKQPDGSFKFKLEGPAMNTMPTPDP